MAVLAAISALAAAACLGYCAGRRATSTPPTWQQRTSRVALGRLVFGLLVVMTARRVRRIRADRVLRDVATRVGSRVAAPLELLRVDVVRMRF
ncbi:hypothetical protein VT930_12800 [Mycobacterium sherrisii]|uniref:hypothetical protein n=1 Tax=Mycobacterium sherrisii TaxID=243061 RepID=UPI002DDD5749|nr:hypothetical protein [Mycobacterium sherrisii]MEC4763980.1 hypothetical protein [Mycobacterium sherrisii]